MSEPRTEAGRDTLADPYFAPPSTPFYDRLRDRILAIEAQARQQVADEIWGRIQYQATTLRTHEAKGVIAAILADLSGLARDTEDGQPNA